MKFGSLCSGIEAASVAWDPLGWEAAWFSQFDPDHNYKNGPDFPSAVLAHHYPHIPNYGDMTKFRDWDNNGTAIDLLVGGTPCQSFSIAGLRKGLADPRGNLMLTYLAIADAHRPRWLVWENVPGVLSSNGGRDFGTFLGGLGELGYGFAYRVLDAQHFGVPQRRRRVFVVGYLGDWRPAAAVLFERHSLSRHSAPRRQAREGIAGTVTARTCRSVGAQGAACGHLIEAFGGNNTAGAIDQAAALNANRGCHNPGDFESGTLLTIQPIAGAADAYGISGNLIGRQAHNGPNGSGISQDVSPTLTKCDRHAVAHAFKVRGGCEGGGKGYLGQDDCAFTVSTGQDQQIAVPLAFQTRIARNGRGQPSDVVPALNGANAGATSDMRPCIATSMAVRRLTPRECERLQGFPDDYTLIPVRKVSRARLASPKKNADDADRYVEINGEVWQMAADGPRYKALGNSMAVPVMHWIGERIQQVEAVINPSADNDNKKGSAASAA